MFTVEVACFVVFCGAKCNILVTIDFVTIG